MSQKLDLGDPNEAYSFTELVRKNPVWMAGFSAGPNDFVDTVPTKPADLSNPHLDAPRDRGLKFFTGLAWGLPLSTMIFLMMWLGWSWWRG